MPSVRRSLTITGTNDKRVQNRRSMFLGLSTPIDIDYTTMVNVLIELGDLLFEEKWESGTVTINLTEVAKSVIRHAENASLKEEALLDEVQNKLGKNP